MKKALSILIFTGLLFLSKNLTACSISATYSFSATLCSNTTTFNINPSGGTAPYAVSFGGGSYSSLLSYTDGCGKTYSVTVKDAFGCTTTTIITSPCTQLNINSITNTPILCYGGLSTITVNAINTNSSTMYQLNGGTPQSSNIFNNILASTTPYNITVTQGGCTQTKTILITQPTPLALTNYITPYLCSGPNSNINLIGSGGTPTYSYSLNSSAYSTTNTYTNKPAGTYTIAVKDANGCINSSIITISTTPAITLNASTTSILCNGNSSVVTLNTVGGLPNYLYTINTSGTSANNTYTVSAGTYTFTTKDVNGCTATVIKTITQPTALNMTTANTNITCNSYTLTATVTGGAYPYLYYFNNTPWGNNIATVTTPTVYTIVAKDWNGCTISKVVNNALPYATVTNTVYDCQNGYYKISGILNNGVSPYKISISNSSYATYSYQSSGSYIVSVKDANGCIKTVLDVLPSFTPISLTYLYGSTVSASGGLAPYTYSATNTSISYIPNSTGIFPNSTGSMTFTVVDANGCTATFVRHDGTFGKLINPKLNITNTNIYPNPVQNELNIDYNYLENEKLIIKIFDLNGKEVNSFNNLNTSAIKLNTTNLINGIYILKILSNMKETKIYKVVKEE